MPHRSFKTLVKQSTALRLEGLLCLALNVAVFFFFAGSLVNPFDQPWPEVAQTSFLAIQCILALEFLLHYMRHFKRLNNIQTFYSSLWRAMLMAVLSKEIQSHYEYLILLEQWISRNAFATFSGFVGFVIFLLKIRNQEKQVFQFEWPHAGLMSSGALFKKTLTEQDLRVAAIHETGHALMCAFLPHLPEDFAVQLHKNPSREAIGTTSYIEWPHRLSMQRAIEWRMLTLLAGQQAEIVANGQACMGSISDHQKWQQEAQNYLKNGLGPMYHIDPKNDAQNRFNAQVLETLRDNQRTFLNSFFLRNIDVVNEMAEDLMAKEKLDAQDVKKHIENIDLGENNPFDDKSMLH